MNLKFLTATVAFLVTTAQMLVAQVPNDVPWTSLNGNILQAGQAFGTCHTSTIISNPADRYVFVIKDTRSTPASFSGGTSPSYTNIWNPATYHHSSWTIAQMGNVFGAAQDSDGNIYLTAVAQAQSSFYGGIVGFGQIGGYNSSNPTSAASIAAGGVVYKINAVTGVVTVFATLPQQQLPVATNNFHAPGLGQIAFDPYHNQLFVSNFENGTIYRLSLAGAVLSTSTPGYDDGEPGTPWSSDIVWALAVGLDGDRLYYSKGPRDVRSISLNPAGDFAGGDRAEFTVALPQNLGSLQSWISDLSFNSDGSKLLVSERTLQGNLHTVYNHNSIAYLYDHQGSGTYALNRSVQVGDDRESYGGGAFGPLSVNPATGEPAGQDQMIWFTSADILDGIGPHGMQAVPVSQLPFLASGTISGINGSTSLYTNHRGRIYAIDYDGLLNTDSKGSGGDIDIAGGGIEGVFYNPEPCPISTIAVTPGACNNNGTASDQTDDYYTANVTVNFSDKPATGNLTLSGAALHSTNSVSTVAVGATTTSTSHTFTGVRLKANNVGNNLTATFSADVACAFTIATLPVVNCSTPPANCAVKDIGIKPGVCNDNGTPSDASDDYYVTDVDVYYDFSPATGNLVLSGAALHSSNSVSTVPVAGLSSSTLHTFVGVRLKANGVANALTATFSADPACTLTVNAPVVASCSAAPPADCTLAVAIPSVPPCSTPDCDMTSVVVTPGACNNNGTNNNEADDYYTADVTVNFTNKPATGNLVLSGAALHASNSVSTVAVGSTTSAGSHTFIGVRLKANGVLNALTATFSADPTCTNTINAPSVNDCSTPDCAITNLVVTPAACNNNGTNNDETDDYYTTDVTVNFLNKPATGNLVLSGLALHASNSVTTVAVGSTTTTGSHIFTGVRLKANGLANAITATFSADPACTLTVNAPSVNECSTPDCDITNLVVTPGVCSDNGTLADATDDYYTASVAVTFSNKPATGNLVLSGVALHSTNSVTTVAVGSTTSATTHTFAGVRLKANGVANAITATFSADPACTMTINAPNVGSCSGGCPSYPPVADSITVACNTSVNKQLSTAGGLAPYTYAVTGGSLPTGLSLTAAGLLSGDPTVVGTFNVTITVTDGNNCTGLINLEIIVSPCYSLGNLVWNDNGAGGGTLNDGIRNGAEPAIANVVVELLNSAGNPYNPGSGAVTTTTNAAGYYRFDNLPAGDYCVRIAASNFNAGNPLNGLLSSAGQSTDFTVAGNNRDHGALNGGAVLSTKVTLGASNPTGDKDAGATGAGDNGPEGDASDNLVVDFGFFAVPAVCLVSDVVVTPGACNDNGTPNDATDDYYTGSVTVSFSNKPATGNLVLSGPALHSSNSVTTVAVGSTSSAGSHTFAGVRLKANGVVNAITASFSADVACTLSVDAPSVSGCSVPPIDCCPQIILGAP